MNYELMSDFEINNAVAGLLEVSGVFDEFVFGNDEREVVYLCERDGLDSIIPVGEFNPCNDPADAWPIISGNKIKLTYEGASTILWTAMHVRHTSDLDCDYIGANSHENPLRAAMIVFLMMSEK